MADDDDLEDCLLFEITTEEVIIDETDSETDGESLYVQHGMPPRPKKPWSLCGTAAYGTKYNKEWESKFPFICHGKTDAIYSFYCTVC